MSLNWKKILPHVSAILIIFLVNVIYFYPQLQGKTLRQSDIISSSQATAALKGYIDEEDKTYLWNPAQFGGMPNLANAPSTNNLIYEFYPVIRLGFAEPIGMFIAGCILGYIALLILGFSPWMSLIFCIPMIFVSGNLILWEAGHNSKIRTLIFTPLLIAGVLSIFENRKYLLGFILLSLGFSLSFFTRHPQMTYYILLMFMVYGVIILIQTIKSKDWDHFGKGTMIVLASVVLGLATSTTKVWSLYDYSEVTMRGKSILKTDNNQPNASSSEVDGLAWDYAMQWSGGVGDVMAMYIPGFVGGGSGEKVSKKSQSYKKYKIEKAPLYWGAMSSTVGPLYQGASIIFLCILGFFILKGNLKWWLGIGLLFMILLSMGNNFAPLNHIIFDFFPLYSKFRAPVSVLNTISFFVVLLAALSFKEVMGTKIPSPKSKKRKKYNRIKKSFLIAYGLCGGIALLFALLGSSVFDFVGAGDARFGVDATPFVDDRRSLFIGDSWRTFIFVSLTAGLIFAYLKSKLKKTYVIAGIGVVILIDLMGIAQRYIGHNDFVPKRKISQEFTERPVDAQIKTLEKDRSRYRVHDVSINSFNSSEASIFHNTIGGYSPAKMQRAQDLIDHHITKSNMQVFNMLNTKYFITKGPDDQPQVQRNQGALGVAWFVSDIIKVHTPNEEINTLNNISAASQAVVLEDEFSGYLDGLLSVRDSTAAIGMTSYEPDVLVYQSRSNREMLAVFSEMWYGPNKGWQAYLDGNPVEYIRANYALRAMRIPAGNHEISFKFRPRPYYIGETITLASSGLLVLLVLGFLYTEYKGKPKEDIVKKRKKTH